VTEFWELQALRLPLSMRYIGRHSLLWSYQEVGTWEHLRVDNRCLDIVRHFIQTDKPMAFVCHSPQILTEALGDKGEAIAESDPAPGGRQV
jgi:hypothetical protein